MVAGETHHFRKPPYTDPHGFEELLQWSLVGHKNTSVTIGSRKSWTLCPTPRSDPMHHKGILGCFLWLKETGDFLQWTFAEFFGEKWCRRLVFFWKLLDETREFLDETSISIQDLLWYGEISGSIGISSMWCVSVCRWIIPPTLSYTQPGKATRCNQHHFQFR